MKNRIFIPLMVIFSLIFLVCCLLFAFLQDSYWATLLSTIFGMCSSVGLSTTLSIKITTMTIVNKSKKTIHSNPEISIGNHSNVGQLNVYCPVSTNQNSNDYQGIELEQNKK